MWFFTGIKQLHFAPHKCERYAGSTTVKAVRYQPDPTAYFQFPSRWPLMRTAHLFHTSWYLLLLHQILIRSKLLMMMLEVVSCFLCACIGVHCTGTPVYRLLVHPTATLLLSARIDAAGGIQHPVAPRLYQTRYPRTCLFKEMLWQDTKATRTGWHQGVIIRYRTT